MLEENKFMDNGFDALRIHEKHFTITVGEEDYTFETPKDEDGRIVFINGNSKSREITYGTYTVTFSCGGASGTLPNPITQNIGRSIILPEPENLEKDDCFFNGWKDNEIGTVYNEGNTAKFTRNVELIAQWISMEGGEMFTA